MYSEFLCYWELAIWPLVTRDRTFQGLASFVVCTTPDYVSQIVGSPAPRQETYIALYEYVARIKEDLSIQVGERLIITDKR